MTPKATYFFTEVEHDILKSVCAYMVGVPSDTPLDIPVIVIDAFVQQLPKALRKQLRFGLHLFQWGPLLFIGKPRGFYTPRAAGCGEIYRKLGTEPFQSSATPFPGLTRHRFPRFL